MWWIHWVTETETMKNFAGSLLPVEIEQGSLKPNYDHKLRTGMKRSPRMKLFSPKFRTWIGQWNVRTLYESGKVAQLAIETRRYRTQQIRIESIMRRNGSGIRYGSLRIIPPVALLSETLRGLEEEVAQRNPGGEV